MTKIEAEETNTDNVLMRHPTRILLWIFAVSVIVGIVCLREVADSPSLIVFFWMFVAWCYIAYHFGHIFLRKDISIPEMERRCHRSIFGGVGMMSVLVVDCIARLV